MSDVVELHPPKPAFDPQIGGKAHCLACKHDWLHVAPVGTIGLSCPSCGCERGVWRYHINPSEEAGVWVCKCGNDLFVLSRTAAICVGCGAMPEEFRRG